jgi:hypothetical protein
VFGREIVSQKVSIDSGTTTRPFAAALSVGEFIRKGFAVDSGTSRIFFAPDAEALLDEEFTRGYCFELARPDATRPRQVGLGFVPVRHQSGRIDIEGTLWIDSLVPALVELDLRYLGLSPAENTLHPGASISFRTMPIGVPAIDRWFIRMIGGAPPYASGPIPPIEADTRRTPSMRRPRLEPHEQGGEVASLVWSAVEWRASLGAIRALATPTGRRWRNAALILAETDYRATTDTNGFFAITELLPGPYVVSFPDSALDRVGLALSRGQRFEAVRDSTIEVDVDAPTVADYIKARCGTMGRDSMLLVARVLSRDGQPVPADITLRMAQGLVATTDTAARRAGAQGSDVNWSPVREMRASSDGLVFICRVPDHRWLRLEATFANDRVVWELDTAREGRRLYTAELRLAPPL